MIVLYKFTFFNLKAIRKLKKKKIIFFTKKINKINFLFVKNDKEFGITGLTYVEYFLRFLVVCYNSFNIYMYWTIKKSLFSFLANEKYYRISILHAEKVLKLEVCIVATKPSIGLSRSISCEWNMIDLTK